MNKLFKLIQKDFKKDFKKFDTSIVFSLLIVIIITFLILSSTFIVAENQIAVVKTLGKYSRTLGTGLHFKLPYPIEAITLIEAGETRPLEIGRDTTDKLSSDFPKNAILITKDDSLVLVNLYIDWKISDPVRFTNNIDDPESFLLNTTLQLLRKIVSTMTFNEILSSDKTSIEQTLKDEIGIEMTVYGSGITVDDVRFIGATPPSAVKDSFAKIDAAAQNKASAIQTANTYSLDRIKGANSEASDLINSNSTYHQDTINKAMAETASFDSYYDQYIINKDVAKARIYYDILEQILPNIKIIIVDSKSGANLTTIGGGN